MKYEIGGKAYIQKPIVLGQIRQLTNLLKGVVMTGDINAAGLISVLGDKLPQAIAIVLNPAGEHLKDKDVNALAKEIEFEISPEQAIEVVNDFFTCNPIPSLLQKVSGMAEKITAKMKETGLSKSASSSQAETSPSEMLSSGALH